MASIENLRKQAKQIIRWHREKHYPVAPIIRCYLPRFQSSSDTEILESQLLLTEAQELVARRAGFDSWSALTKGVQTMDESKVTTQKAQLIGAEAQLFVTDLDISISYYQKLGFEIAFTYGEPPYYAQVQRDGVPINLRLAGNLPFDPARMESESMLSLTITTKESKPLYLEFVDAGAVFHQRLKKEPWGAQTFIVKDPDGNLILFAGD